MPCRRRRCGSDLVKPEASSYRYVILGTAVLVVFAALGLSQFSYPAILPAMQEDLGLTNTQAGRAGHGEPGRLSVHGHRGRGSGLHDSVLAA